MSAHDRGAVFHRRRLHLEDTTAKDVLVYRVFDGNELLFERRGTEEEIQHLRARVEPLQATWHATLGSGRPDDPEVARGGADEVTPEVRQSLAAAREIHELTMKVARDNLQMAEFIRVLVAETTRAVRLARDEEAAKWQEILHRVQTDTARPLVSADDLRRVLQDLPNLIKNIRGGNG